jgi:uncharacterized protein (TIGR02646 family)
MRQITRLPLTKRQLSYLAKRQTRVNDGQAIELAWRGARSTLTMKQVFGTLTSMAGDRCRCFYCEDSRGTDIDHFWPKVPFPDRAFIWDNMLLSCSGCNNHKKSKFPRDGEGLPLLIDPTNEDPWDHLFFDNKTGELTARWLPEGAQDPKGLVTTGPDILPLNIELITNGRKRTLRNLERFVSKYLADFEIAERRDESLASLIEALRENDDYGLTEWCFVRDGREFQPFSSLREMDPGGWQEILQALT